MLARWLTLGLQYFGVLALQLISDFAAGAPSQLTTKQPRRRSLNLTFPNMTFSPFLKIFVLFVLLVANVNAATSDPARRLHIEPSAALPPTRELSGKNPISWFRIIKTNVANQPIVDKGKELLDKVKKLKEDK
ncbi:hypothetical protein PHYBOEH_003782 [Phytophthora boehmeriae]|uniref:RxLR effector protein n=1 Tax=Phytophthora boehmeriae TaxID=109152 RepID=A0A8T1V4V0_9STRA|nr:hypothetical protein PHYBOEH_003782 [Phytophthora boehmeriae]